MCDVCHDALYLVNKSFVLCKKTSVKTACKPLLVEIVQDIIIDLCYRSSALWEVTLLWFVNLGIKICFFFN
jgi:hypothetical protein